MPADPSSASPSEREIEAVARERLRAPSATKEKLRSSLILVLDVLDRVRDARGDDGIRQWLETVPLDREKLLAEFDEEFAARSPQGEDHEAERRAEIEAFLRDTLAKTGWSDPMINGLLTDLQPYLDRVRDARGDDRVALNQTRCSGCTEVVKDEEPLRFRSGVLWHEACLAARSPQDEDHDET